MDNHFGINRRHTSFWFVIREIFMDKIISELDFSSFTEIKLAELHERIRSTNFIGGIIIY